MSLKLFFAFALVLIVGVLGFQTISHAQTYNSSTMTTNGTVNGTTNTNGTTGTGTTGTGTGTGTVNGTTNGTTNVPGVPNTGAGGDASLNILLLAGSALLMAGGTLYFVKNVRA